MGRKGKERKGRRESGEKLHPWNPLEFMGSGNLEQSFLLEQVLVP